ncbi:hypothetical protein ACFWPH_32020 [Nocardia sp. NPDC058499]|uniref:hypothetical protein n=1 Tax=Nocardia sp. NPDC058499 TaxID=3346530 RepID=UPI00365378D3
MRSSIRVTDRPPPRRRSGHSLRNPGSRSASIMPTLWALGTLLGGVILLLAVLTLTHLDTPAGALAQIGRTDQFAASP